MNWIKRLFTKKEDGYKPRVRTMFDFFTRYQEAYHEWRVMKGYIWDITRNNCEHIIKLPSKKIARRYSLKYEDCNGLAWYLLEKYSEGKIKIEDEELQPKPRAGAHIEIL